MLAFALSFAKWSRGNQKTARVILPTVLYGYESVMLKEEHTDDVWKQGAEEKIWSERSRSDGRVEKTA
jgi:hypothetical protein